MKRVFTAGDIKAMDAHEIAKNHNELGLIRKAGAAVAEEILGLSEEKSALFFCGSGNNGADGVAAACNLAKQGWETRVYAVRWGESSSLTTLYEEYRTITGRGVEPLPTDIKEIPPYGVLIDAMLGTGARFGLSGEYLRCAELIRALSPGKIVFSVDVPTGVCADTGRADASAVRADATVCLSGYKPGVLLYPGVAHAGKLSCHSVIEDPFLPQRERYWFSRDDVHSLKRERNTHKGSYGRLGIIGGSMNMPGAALMCAEAAIRSGAGTVTLASDDETARCYALRVREVMVRGISDESARERFYADKTTLVIGPGLGESILLPRVLYEGASLGVPVLIDADGLNALSKIGPDLTKNAKGPVVLTPHPKELSRLMGVELATVLSDPMAMAEAAAERFGCTVLLKGATTVVVGENTTWFCTRGCAGMAKGGSGDVLSGVIGGLLAMGEPLPYAAAAGSYFAGIAGEAAMERYGSTAMTPGNTIEMLFQAYMPFEQ